MSNTNLLSNGSTSLLNPEFDIRLTGMLPAIEPGCHVKRILLPFDLSKSSVMALRAASQLADRFGSSIHLFYVVRGSSNSPSFDYKEDRITQATERVLKAWVKRIVPTGIKTSVSIRTGEPVEIILDYAASISADIIVMTSSESRPGQMDEQRCTAERLSRLALCPVITLPEKYLNRQRDYRLDKISEGAIFVPVNYASVSEYAIAVSASVAALTGWKIIAAHGVESDYVVPDIEHARLESWVYRHIDPTVEIETIIWPGGHSLYALLAEAIKTQANLIVLPTRSEPWAQHLRAGSITDGVLRRAHCPVLSISENVGINEEWKS